MKIYVCVFIVACITLVFSYFAGVRIGDKKCRLDMAMQSGVVQSHAIKIMGDVNAETFNRGAGDIRDVLRKKWTIAE